MAITIVISDQDRLDAETFLETYLSERLPSGDFSKGTFLRDIVISAVAYTVAYLRSEASLIQSAVSVKTLLNMTPGTDRDDAADDLMSNWFLSRKDGRPSRGSILVYLSQAADTVVPITTKFYKTTSLVYTPDYTSDVLIPKERLISITDITGAITSRYFTLNVVSALNTTDTNINTGTWISWDPVSPYITKVENIAPFSGGQGIETTDEFISRAPDAIATRDLNSARSIIATLKDQFNEIDDIVVISAGDEELRRDLAYPGTQYEIHTGGFSDVYIKSSVIPGQVYEATIGSDFTLPIAEVIIFRDSNISSFITSGVTVGMILRIYNANTNEPTEYFVSDVEKDYLIVSRRNPFPGPRTSVSYSIGDNYPDYNNIIGQILTGQFNNTVTDTNKVLLPEHPVYRVTGLTVYDSTGALVADLGNDFNVASLSGKRGTNYTISFDDSSYTNTALQIGRLTVDPTLFGYNSGDWDGYTLRLQYDSLTAFDSIDAFMSDNFNRVACANIRAKGLFPVYVGASINYYLGNRATGDIDTTAAAIALANYINGYASTEVLDISDITAFLRNTYSNIGAITPFTLQYYLYDATGNIVPYASNDFALIESTKETTAPPILSNPLQYGISSRTIRFLSFPELITLTKNVLA